MATDLEQELKRTTALRGFRFGLHDFVAENAGVSPEEILETIELIGGWAGNVAKINGLEAWRATFRPDLPTIDRVVELQ